MLRAPLRTHFYLLVAATLLPLVVLFAHELKQEIEDKRAETAQQASILARMAVADIETAISESAQLLASLARRPLVRALDADRCDPVLADLGALSTRYDSLLTFDLEGKPVCASAPEFGLPMIHGSITATAVEAVAANRLVIGTAVRRERDGKWILPVAYPLRADDERTVGALWLGVDLARLGASRQHDSALAGIELAIIDTAGLTLARWPQAAQGIGQPLADSLPPASFAEPAPTVTRVLNGERGELHVATVPVRGTAWRVVAAVPAAKLMGEVKDSSLTYVVGLGGTLALVLTATAYIRRRIETPIMAIGTAARAAGQGDLSVHVPETGPTDLAELAHQFNLMLDALAAQRKSLEESQLRLHGVLQAVGEAIYSTTVDGSRLYFISQAAQNVIGHAPAELYAKPWLWLDAVAGLDRPLLKGRIASLIEQGFFEVRYRIRRPDGSERWLHDRAWLVRDDKGRALRIDGIVSDASDRVQAEQALHESESRFRSIAEASPLPLSIVSYPDGIVRYANAAYCRAFGIDAGEVADSETFSHYADPRDREVFIRRLGEEGRLTNFEVALKRRDGQIFWVVESARMGDFKGEPAIYKAYADITVRKQVEQSLRASEERFRTLVSALAEGVVLHDAAGRVVTCNSAAERILGLPRERIIGIGVDAPHWRALHEDGSPMAVQAHPAMVTLSTGDPVDDRVMGLATDERGIVWLSVSSRPLYYPEAPRPYAVVVSFDDITASREAAQALRRGEARLAGIIGSAMDAIITIDQDQCITVFNAAAEQMFGYSASEMLGRPIDRLIPEGSRRTHAELVRRFGESGVSTRRMGTLGRISGLRASGEEFPAEASISQLIADGEHAYTVIIHDITESVRAEQERRQLTEGLEQRVAERTAELEYANRELEAVSYAVSHDLRAPLRSLNGFAHILQETERERLSQEGRELLDRLMANAIRMGQLIDDILLFSRISRTEPQMAEVDMTVLARVVVEELARDYPKARVSVGELGLVSGDPGMLRQVLINLVGNALKFSAGRDVPVIEIGSTAQAARRVFFVRDNGAGFDPQYAGHLFEVFQRLHSMSEFPGSGIGLAIVKRIIDRHKGSIWADAAPQQGATFYFTIGDGTGR